MARYVDGHRPTVANPDVGNTVVTIAIVAGAGLLFWEWLKRQSIEVPGTGPGGLLNPDTWENPNPAIVPGSLYMDPTGRWCWRERLSDGSIVDRCASQPGFDYMW